MSKAPPKSTKKGSSTGPANTFSPVLAMVTARCINVSYFGTFKPTTAFSIDLGPMLFGGTIPFVTMVVKLAPPSILLSKV